MTASNFSTTPSDDGGAINLPEPGEMARVMMSDNKKTQGGTKSILLGRVGKCLDPDGDYQVKVPAETVRAILEDYKQH